MSARMKRLAFSILLCLLGYTLSSYGKQESPPTEKAVEDPTLERMSQKTWTHLRGMFENPLIDKDFKTLKQVTRSHVYLDFLKQAYPSSVPFETLNGLLKVTMTAPPHEIYETFLTEHFEDVTQADFQSIHLLTQMYRYTDIKMQIAEWTKDQEALREAMMHRVSISMKEPIRTWWKSRIYGEKKAKQLAFINALDNFAKETQKEDAHWIQAQFDAHGQEHAMLWIAIRKPRLLGEILINFREPDTFLRWVELTAILQKNADAMGGAR